MKAIEITKKLLMGLILVATLYVWLVIMFILDSGV